MKSAGTIVTRIYAKWRSFDSEVVTLRMTNANSKDRFRSWVMYGMYTCWMLPELCICQSWVWGEALPPPPLLGGCHYARPSRQDLSLNEFHRELKGNADKHWTSVGVEEASQRTVLGMTQFVGTMIHM